MKHQLVSDQLQVSIHYAGAEICSVKNTAGLEFMWQADRSIWQRHAPVLFPIVGKLKENNFFHNEKQYSLSQHGFARDKDFELIEGDARSCTFELKSDEESKKTFPFDFILQIKYELDKNQLLTSYKIINPSSQILLFSIGAHPGFNCPLKENESFEDYYLEFEPGDFYITPLNDGLRKSSEEKENLYLENNKLPLTTKLFEQDALVFENKQINKISLVSTKSKHTISLECKNWPYFGIWSKKGCSKFICLEPWYGIADNETSSGQFSLKEGILSVAPKKDFECSFSLSFE